MRIIRIGHSPEPHAAVVFSALAAGKIRIPDAEIEFVLEDIESLNRRARAGDLEVTALSAAAYTLVADRYRLTDPGACMARGDGPVLVARERIDPHQIPDRVVAIPGSHTTASLLLRLYVAEEPPLIEVQSDKIPQVVLEGQADLGLLIHAGEITYRSLGLVKVLDLADAWQRDTGLPVPLGVNAGRRDLGDDLLGRISGAISESIVWARLNADEALDHAMRFGRGMDRAIGRPFVQTPVNDFRRSLGAEGQAALERLYTAAHRRGLIGSVPPIDPI
jgi:1,4-dihydroxy-6-naphthoate synthase